MDLTVAYTGDVAPGGPPARRELPHLTITKISVGPLDNNAYLLRCVDTGDQVLVDAADEPARLLAVVGDDGLTTVVTTHRHPDHWQALSKVLVATGARSVAHEADAGEIPVVHDTVREGDTIRVGDCDLAVVHLVGHTPGSIALVYRDPEGSAHVFTGDSLFPGGVGNTRGDEDNFRSLVDDVEHKLFDALPDDTWVYPGHGRDTTLGAERPALPEWRARGW
jgi:glyoxylase-like metal-dependent hydrolase (beta-lactamase superfamily II)